MLTPLMLHYKSQVSNLMATSQANPTSPRIKPLSPPYSAEMQSSFDTIMPSGMAPLGIFRTVGHNPRVLQRMVNGGLLDKGSISVSERELIILRTCSLCGAEYEWGVHVASFAGKAGFNPEQIADTAAATSNLNLWSPQQQLLITLSEQLHHTNRVEDALWDKLQSYYQAEQLIELVMVAGLYHAVSFVVNACQVAPEAFAPSFPHTNQL